MRLFITLLVLPWLDAAPSPEKLAFSLAEPDDVVKTENPKGLFRFFHELSENTYVKDFMSLMNIMSSAADSPTKPALPVARGVRIQNVQRRVPITMADTPGAQFEHSLSLDDAPQITPAEKSSISKEEWAATLFGERGVLTGVFQMMDQQRKAQNTQSDSAAPTINGKKLDLKEVFDQLLMGTKKGELGDSGPELPEFLGLCNRLSCGDIYKAIDKFRTSEFFSNFQTALGLIQDPNGWETLGKLMSNPELISQFTAGSGMEQLFGSALGQAKKESNRSHTKNSKLLPEDGDFGIDFSEDGDSNKEKKPEIDFSVDMKPETSDYYEEVSKGTNISPDYDNMEETVDVAPPPPPSTRSMSTTAPASTTIYKTIQGMKKPTMIEPGMPDISFSIDGPLEEGEAETVVDAAPPPVLTKSAGASGRRPVMILTTTRRTTTRMTTPSTITRRTTTTVKTTKWTPPTTTTPKATTKNYRKDSDYYSMYYDDQSH